MVWSSCRSEREDEDSGNPAGSEERQGAEPDEDNFRHAVRWGGSRRGAWRGGGGFELCLSSEGGWSTVSGLQGGGGQLVYRLLDAPTPSARSQAGSRERSVKAAATTRLEFTGSAVSGLNGALWFVDQEKRSVYLSMVVSRPSLQTPAFSCFVGVPPSNLKSEMKSAPTADKLKSTKAGARAGGAPHLLGQALTPCPLPLLSGFARVLAVLLRRPNPLTGKSRLPARWGADSCQNGCITAQTLTKTHGFTRAEIQGWDRGKLCRDRARRRTLSFPHSGSRLVGQLMAQTVVAGTTRAPTAFCRRQLAPWRFGS